MTTRKRKSPTMKSKVSIQFLLLAIFFFANSCNRFECRNINPVFDKYTFDTKEYKKELARKIQSVGTENLSYWFEGYQKKSGKEFIVIHIHGGELCAKGEIQVNDWRKISGMRRGVSGYSGAELRGLKIEIEQDSTGTNFIYDNIDKIID